MVKHFTQNNITTITLSPNRSATWAEAKMIVFIMALCVLLIASIWALLGMWLILPFAGFEVALLAFLMHKVNRHCYSKQIITINPKTLIIECGIQYPIFNWQFERHKTHLSVIEAESSFDRPHMILTDENISIELGQFLNQQDCLIARNLLKHNGVMEVSNKWWKRQ
ncbi:DUF2244 domain-containing protein [Aliiglaciecola sp. 2_MG-2023]|uniref:DUF2244 domain-containing protein n=1 Tax=Alteromonadaceae TaxID=72275 RepID=UPI0026E4602B|nr:MULTISPECIES: DUF2244 domain-containing protein [unclassified Aliiglaciecola]MDO6710946.1 DUF2244 domain-containing protein [Aliiglaciecola sp. 2_MG-2023]MDO6752427.1 DUF2244 domain-containing protein [Aliiglaciecola sp. 1_MG-2023]